MSNDSQPNSYLIVRENAKGARHHTRGLSPLMVNIMAVNAMALFILVGGVLYLNQFYDDLIEARIETLKIQAEIIGNALGESSAVVTETDTIDLAAARQIISRLVGPTDDRARLFTRQGMLIADSQFLAGEKRIIAEELPALDQPVPIAEIIENTIFEFLADMRPVLDAPPHIDTPGIHGNDLSEVGTALTGETAVQLRRHSDGGYMINIAVPVQRFRRVLGALVLTGQTEDIEDIVRSEQMTTVRIFAGALFITILLSFFLGRRLARPIRVLARAAERVRRGIGREDSIPEFAHRRDEIGDLSRSLSDMTRALYNQIDAVERFAADVAHELKNPLSSLRSAVETLRRTNRPDLQKRLFDVIEDDVKRLDRLISDISDASRLDAELTRGHMQNVDIGVMLNTLNDAYDTMHASKNNKLNGVRVVMTDLEAGIFLVQGIDGRLGQVWNNLIDNAVSFSPKNADVHITAEIKNGFAHIEVRDQGPGLPEGSEEKIFSRFYSERPETEAFGNHSGLGLAISRQVIEAHGGTINAENIVGNDNIIKGAVFKVSLPLANSHE